MSRVFEGRIICLMGSNRACYHISRLRYRGAHDTPKFVFVIIPEISFSELALKICVLIYF